MHRPCRRWTFSSKYMEWVNTKKRIFFVDKRRHLVRAFFIVLLSVYRYFFAFFEYKFKKNIFLLIMIS